MAIKLSTQPYKGARDFYPEDMRVRNYIFDTWRNTCKLFGFEEYDFPILEPFEIFASKTGEEIVNEQLFSFEDKAKRKLAIRPEITPGTVRMIAKKYGELPKPLKWYMIGNNWRFEKPQLGRGREFYQLEVNTFGVEDITADYEIFTIIIKIMNNFGGTDDMFTIKLSDRRLISCLLADTLNINPDIQAQVRKMMDKRMKISDETFSATLTDLGLNNNQINKIDNFMHATIESLHQIIPQQTLNNNLGYTSIIRLLDLLKENNIQKYCMFDPSIIRGFDYSDGLVYEVFDKNPNNRRSMFGGERFDRLINIFGEFALPATGFAMGDITLLEFLKGWNLLPTFYNETKYLVTLWPNEDSKYLKITLDTARTLRERGQNVQTWLEPNTKLDKQLKYADQKQIPFVIIIGEDELTKGVITIKDMVNKTQKTITTAELLEKI